MNRVLDDALLEQHVLDAKFWLYRYVHEENRNGHDNFKKCETSHEQDMTNVPNESKIFLLTPAV